MNNKKYDPNTQNVHETEKSSDHPKTHCEYGKNKPDDVKNKSDEIKISSDLKSNGDLTSESTNEKDDKLSEATDSRPDGDNDNTVTESKTAKDVKSSQTEDSKFNISESDAIQENSKQHSSTEKDNKEKCKAEITEKDEVKEEINDNKENVKEKNDSSNEMTRSENISGEDCRYSDETKSDKPDSLPSPKATREPSANTNEESTNEVVDDETKSNETEHHGPMPNEAEVEFEDVEIPEEVNELIVPDEDEDLTNSAEGGEGEDKPFNDEEITKDSEVEAEGDEITNSKNQEDEETNDSPIESELVAIEESVEETSSSEEDRTTNDVDDVSNNTADDPLNCLGSQRQEGEESNNSESVQQEAETKSDFENQEDDDDVQFIETRNSPICIESDEEDSRETGCSVDQQTISLPSTTITVPKNLTVTRTSARKSTARRQSAASSPQTVPHIQKKTKNFSYLDKATTYRRSLPASLTITTQNVVDTIEVLDSSDEDSSSHNKSLPQKQRTPPKRTLLAAKSVQANKALNKAALARRGMPNHFSTHIRQQAKKPAPPPLPPPTPQSNFLNNVQLQPAAAGSNPPAFSALLSNKSVIIPNAFYGNPPSVRGNPADAETERRYARWLENFITQFCNPQLVASHSCFVFLQRALKYKDFVRVKNIRTNLNVHAQTATDHLNHQLMLDLRAIFLKGSREITPHGRRFCEMACSTPQNKTVTLLIHASTGRIIMKSCNMELPSTTTPAPSTSNNTNSTSTTSRKRRVDEDEYVPVKNKMKSTGPSENGEDGNDDEGRSKRPLRSKRAKRLDNSFSYNEDDLAEYDIDDEEEAERTARAEIQRKIDQKRLEAQRQRQQQAKSFETAFIQAFAKNIVGKSSKTSPPTGNRGTGQRARLNNSLTSASVQQHLANNDAEDLLQATWIENVENEDAQIISDDEEPKQHRIYKQQQQQQQLQLQLQHSSPREVSTRNNVRKENHQQQPPYVVDVRHWPKNTDAHLHCISKNRDTCVVCKLNVQRIVHHYVNEHRGCEVYTSRFTSSQVEHLRRGSCNILNVTLYKNGQPQYEAHCIFCQKQSRFMLPYWIQHFTMHTGEYAYRCSGCGIRKPTRSLLTQHHSQGCPGNGSVLQDYTHDTKRIRVEARICTLCNFVQLHRSNIVKHLHQQHGIKQILPKHIQTIVLLKMDASTDSSAAWPAQQSEVVATRRQPQTFTSPSSSSGNTYVIEDDDDDTLLFGDTIQPPTQEQRQVDTTNAQNYSYNYIPPYMMNSNNNYAWEENTPGDDLSYMICGMLDVQMNSE